MESTSPTKFSVNLPNPTQPPETRVIRRSTVLKERTTTLERALLEIRDEAREVELGLALNETNSEHIERALCEVYENAICEHCIKEASGIEMACGICWEPGDRSWTCPITRNLFCSPCMAEYLITVTRYSGQRSGPWPVSSWPCPEVGYVYRALAIGGANPPPVDQARNGAARVWQGHVVSMHEGQDIHHEPKEEAIPRLRTRVWLYLHTRRCPRCRTHVQRTEGCPHMRCVCREEFCYECGKAWNNHTVCRQGLAKTVVYVMTAPFWVPPYLLYKGVRTVCRRVSKSNTRRRAGRQGLPQGAPPAA